MNKEVKKSKILRRRAFILGISKSLITGMVISKLYYLQILQKSKYGKLSESNKTKIKIKLFNPVTITFLVPSIYIAFYTWLHCSLGYCFL